MCRRLKEEFPDISISKIRYLEDQGLLAPRRTQGGYRLYSEEDLERLTTILRLQRDEFLPLRVIREELLTPARKRKARRKPAGERLRAPHPELVDFDDLCEQATIDGAFAKELLEFGLIEEIVEADRRGFSEADVDIATLCARLARFGVAPRNLRAFRTGIDREAALIEQIVAPALRSRNPERTQAALDDLDKLAELSLELSQLLFWRALRTLVASST
ncbi:MAG: MerR family transcriptional regulator [Thermoleophilia bacterium]